MNEEELAFLTSHSTVLGDQDIEELKESEIIKEFEGISLKAIFEGRETFREFDKLIRILNLSFKYDIDLYQQLLTFLVRRYVLKCRNNVSIVKGLINPVMMDVKKEIDNEGLYNYLFTGNPTGLKPEDIFRTKELLLLSTQHFEEKAFTSEVVAEGISCITSSKGIEDMFGYLENYPFDVSYKDLVKASIDRDNAVLLDYLINKHKDRLPPKGNVIINKADLESYTYFDYATIGDSFKCLKYLHVALKVDNLKHKTACSNAATSGSLECLTYLHENNFPWNVETCRLAARNGHLDCLKYAHENNCHWNVYTCTSAARNGHLDCLKYAHENDCPWDEDTCSEAANGGHLECLKYAHENDCPWDVYTCTLAALNGHLDCLKYAHENDFPWDEDTCAWSAFNGHLDCLKYAHENDCPWDERTCMHAASEDHLDCLKYAHENDCPWDERTCRGAAKHGNLDCLKYIKENDMTC